MGENLCGIEQNVQWPDMVYKNEMFPVDPEETTTLEVTTTTVPVVTTTTTVPVVTTTTVPVVTTTTTVPVATTTTTVPVETTTTSAETTSASNKNVSSICLLFFVIYSFC